MFKVRRRCLLIYFNGYSEVFDSPHKMMGFLGKFNLIDIFISELFILSGGSIRP